jgi:hypothetical protein
MTGVQHFFAVFIVGQFLWLVFFHHHHHHHQIIFKGELKTY